jgi:Bacterial CdiA-CT RNAse A domain
MAKLILFRATVLLGVIALVACNAPPASDSSSMNSPARADRNPALSGPSRDLTQDEAAGGHVLRKHVGRTDEQLRERLEDERHISGASTYTDRPTAEHAIGAAIAQSQDRIQRWLSRSGGRPNLVLDYDSPQPIGRTLNRGETQTHPCAHALVVLKYDDPGSYHVLTSYPECR